MRSLIVLVTALLLPALLLADAPTIQSAQRVYCGGSEEAEVKFASIDTSAGDATIVAAVAGKKIRVLSYLLSTDAANGTARFESGTGGTALTGQMRTGAYNVLPMNCFPGGCFETAAGALLNLETTTTVYDGHLTYIECE